jgi:ubiquinone/menaquinone biosynthesis C-methylase UbiE
VGGGPALEFAIGTGRVALPLHARGVPMTGIDRSAPMLARLRGKPGGAEIPVVVGDMATTRVPGEFGLVYLVYNTITNLLAQDEQVACFRNAARHLAPGAASSSRSSCRSCAGSRPERWRVPSPSGSTMWGSTPTTSLPSG